MTELFEKRWEKDFSEVQVVKAEWFVTRRCNMRCSYCKIRDASSLRGKELDTNTLVSIVEMFGRLWPGAPMVVYGGEPTLRDDLSEIIAAGKKHGVKLPVISNSIRIMKDRAYLEELIDAGLDNWSVSFDGLTDGATIGGAQQEKSEMGLKALRVLRDEYGVRDLVVCITVSKWNISLLPLFLEMFTAEGVHSIFTPIHIGGEGYEYGCGERVDLPLQGDIERVSKQLYDMVSSGKFLCSNDAAWFKTWPEYFLHQNWMCNDKGLLTIDADGSLRYCVDIPFREEDHMFVWELDTEGGREKYQRIIQKKRPCHGCLWNPAYESIKRSRDPEIGIEEGRLRARHYVDPERLSILHGGAGRWFEGNPELKRVM
jgi:MoaA/NifB/PqqE/SkfB family radical SAM enzyme